MRRFSSHRTKNFSPFEPIKCIYICKLSSPFFKIVKISFLFGTALSVPYHIFYFADVYGSLLPRAAGIDVICGHPSDAEKRIRRDGNRIHTLQSRTSQPGEGNIWRSIAGIRSLAHSRESDIDRGVTPPRGRVSTAPTSYFALSPLQCLVLCRTKVEPNHVSAGFHFAGRSLPAQHRTKVGPPLHMKKERTSR